MNHSFSSPYYALLIGGDYQAIVLAAVDQVSVAATNVDLPWVIGALTFLGRSREAEGIFGAHRSSMTTQQKVASRFFLSVAFCREGKISASRKALLENARDARKSHDLIAQFFHYQGFAFYRYTTGRLEKALVWVEAGLKAASGSSFAYGSALAFELLGHVQLLAGQFHAGFRHLNFAKDRVALLGQGAFYQAIDISIVLYQASFGIARESSDLVQLLDSYIGDEHFQDSYTQAALNLELARIYILRGELFRAKEQLELSSQFVYKINNPDLELDYNLQFAHLLRCQGEIHQALSLVRGARHRVEAGHDLRARVRVLGFEVQLLKALGRSPEAEAILPDLQKLSHRCGTLMARRYLLRHQLEGSSDVRPGEDLLGDLIDRVIHFKEGVIADILRGGWYGLLLSPLNVLAHEHVIYFDAEPGSLTIFQKGDVFHQKDGCTTLIRKLLILLSQRPCSKEDLANHLWRQAYNPIRHDGLIYPLITKARRFLGRAGDWIEAYELGYRLRQGIRIASSSMLYDEPGPEPSVKILDGASQRGESFSATLNTRQTYILEALQRGETVEPGALIKKLGVSDATITRDMATLIELGFAKRIGRGRATRYCIDAKPD